MAGNSEKKRFGWRLAGATTAVGASACCAVPLVLALGVGGAWASRLAVVERFRPLFIGMSLLFLGIGLFQIWKSSNKVCIDGAGCEVNPNHRLNRLTSWSLFSLVVLGILALPSAASRLFARNGGHCVLCSTISAADDVPPPETAKTPIEPGREIVFQVRHLGCSLVKGVGCGHILAPTLTSLNQLEGVSKSFSNWTGEQIRVVAASETQREAIVERVAVFLTNGHYEPSQLKGKDFEKALKEEGWWSLDRIQELSTFEFKTVSKRQVEAFAQREGLDKSKKDLLLKTINEIWEKSSLIQDKPATDEEGYHAYWAKRRSALKAAFKERVTEILSAEQIDRLLNERNK